MGQQRKDIDDMSPIENGGSGRIEGKMEADDAGTGGSAGSEKGITGGNSSGYGKDTGDPADMGWESVHGRGAETEGGATGDNSETRTTGGMTGGAGAASNTGAGTSGSGSSGKGGGS